MKFALNYSPQAVELWREGAIPVDLFKCPDWPDLIAIAQAWRPVYVHFPLLAGQNNLDKVGIDAITHWLNTTETQFVNTHIAALKQADESREQVIEAVIADLNRLVAEFGADRVIVENIPYPDTRRDKSAFSVDADLISQAIRETGTRLLLDLGHARRTAEHLAIDPRIYIEQLPVDRLAELHVTGLGYHQGRREDHLPMRDEDWDLLDWALIKIHTWARPSVIACEYGGIGPQFEWRSVREVIAAQIPLMYEKVTKGIRDDTRNRA
ncbi:MAG: DUF692 family protein [Anaerolineae bacterium]|jgi:uncharacterized protein (UPF0276 family)|nr:DUF692 family protein [Anaerolineae bacterium]